MALNHYSDNTQHYARHDAEAAARSEQELRDIIMQKLLDIFEK